MLQYIYKSNIVNSGKENNRRWLNENIHKGVIHQQLKNCCRMSLFSLEVNSKYSYRSCNGSYIVPYCIPTHDLHFLEQITYLHIHLHPTLCTNIRLHTN